MMVGFLQQGMPGVEIPFLNWTVLWFAYVMLYVILWPLIVKYIFRLDFSAVAKINLSEMADKDVRITNKQKFGLGCLIVFISMMLLQQLLPQTWVFTQILTRLGLSGCLLVIISIMAGYCNANGEHFISLQGAAKGIQWNVMWLIIATEPIANALNSADCGIMASIMAVVTPILTSLNPTIFLAICIIVIGLLTQVVHNLVFMVIFIPMLCPMYLQIGGNPLVMFIGLIIATNAAFATPAASWSAAMMFGESSVIKSKTYLHGFLHFVFSLVLFFILGMPLANLILPFMG